MVFYYNLKYSNTVNCRVHIQRSRPLLKMLNYGDNHLLKECTNPKQTSREPSPNDKKYTSVHTTFNTNAHIP